jgi:hypothetical protein
LDIDGIENFETFYEGSEFDFVTFSHLCLYAMILHRTEVIELLDKKYGGGIWQKKFKDHYRGQTSGLEQAISEAQGRHLIVYKK